MLKLLMGAVRIVVGFWARFYRGLPPLPDGSSVVVVKHIPAPLLGIVQRMSLKDCYLVDPASSHMLVSKIKPCMCKYEQFQTVKLRMAH